MIYNNISYCFYFTDIFSVIFIILYNYINYIDYIDVYLTKNKLIGNIIYNKLNHKVFSKRIKYI